jgi:hypothetical protein
MAATKQLTIETNSLSTTAKHPQAQPMHLQQVQHETMISTQVRPKHFMLNVLHNYIETSIHSLRTSM